VSPELFILELYYYSSVWTDDIWTLQNEEGFKWIPNNLTVPLTKCCWNITAVLKHKIETSSVFQWEASRDSIKGKFGNWILISTCYRNITTIPRRGVGRWTPDWRAMGQCNQKLEKQGIILLNSLGPVRRIMLGLSLSARTEHHKLVKDVMQVPWITICFLLLKNMTKELWFQKCKILW
jgi:hypothetical protein